ncbi:hypothetical protein EGW08_009027 [Elysia chlorotica]|uniref:SMB domain-containing protein n=1 Tax=Elysia chlorotica TaxID=188477 RepID=A0A433TNY7_ELYCH|nr:hypothetical protein EGW08_009027 [Elysia chlorotica]
MIGGTIYRRALGFIILLATQFLSMEDRQKVYALTNISQRTPNDPSGMASNQSDKSEDFGNGTEYRFAGSLPPGEDWSATEVPSTQHATNSLTTQPVLTNNSEPGLVEKLVITDELVPPTFCNLNCGLIGPFSPNTSNIYLGEEQIIDRIFNSSTLSDFRNFQDHTTGMKKNVSDDGELNTEINNYHDEVKSAYLELANDTGGLESLHMTTSGTNSADEEALTYTCKNRCGTENMFPCTCSALCVVYDTCCENFSIDCPHILQDAKARFGNLIASDKVCGKNFVFVISSCPRQSETNKLNAETEELQSNKTEGEASSEVSFNQITPVDSLTTSPPALGGSQESVAKRLKVAALKAFVTDLSSGVTYINKTVYDCHNHKGSFSVWALRLDYIYTNPRSLEDLAALKALDRYEPLFNKALLSRHICDRSIIETCPATWHPQEVEKDYDKQCSEFFALTTWPGTDGLEKYRNRYCAYCNKGKNISFVLQHHDNMIERDIHLRILMSISQSGQYNIKVKRPAFLDATKISWSQTSCKPRAVVRQDTFQETLSRIAPEEKLVCSTKCSSSRFTLRKDGYCKALHFAKVAVSDDGLPPLCPEALEGLGSFISCGLEKMIKTMPHAEFQQPIVSVQFDTKTQKTLYIVKIKVDLVSLYTNFFSTKENDGIINWRHLEVLAKSLKHYRLSNDICSGSGGYYDRYDQKQVTTFPFQMFLSSSSLRTRWSDQINNRIGPVVDAHDITSFCMSATNEPKKYEQETLICQDAVVYADDANAIADFYNSTCFTHLDNVQLAHGRGDPAHNVRDNHSHWLLVTVVWVVVMGQG